MKDQAKFLKHLLKHQHDLRAFIGSIIRDRTTRDDVFQDVALILWRKFEDFDESRSFGAWARGIASRRVMQLFEKNRKLPITLSPEAIQAIAKVDPAPANTQDAEENALRICLEKLPERSRRLVDMRYDRSLRLRDIATEVSSSLDAVHKALSRIRDGLKRCIEKELLAEGGLSA